MRKNLGEERILLGKIAKRSFRTVKFLLSSFPATKFWKPASAELCLSSNQFERSECICAKHGWSSVVLSLSEAIHQEQVARGSSLHQSRRLIKSKKKGEFLLQIN